MTGEKYADWSEPMVYMPRQEFDKLRDSIPWQSGPVPADAELDSIWLAMGGLGPMIVEPVIDWQGNLWHRIRSGGRHEPGTVGTHCCRIQPPEDTEPPPKKPQKPSIVKVKGGVTLPPEDTP